MRLNEFSRIEARVVKMSRQWRAPVAIFFVADGVNPFRYVRVGSARYNETLERHGEEALVGVYTDDIALTGGLEADLVHMIKTMGAA